MHKLRHNFNNVSCRIENLAWNTLYCHYNFIAKAVTCIVCFILMIALNHNDLKWVFCCSHCALNVPMSLLSDCSSSTLSWLWEWHQLCWQSPTVYTSWWPETEGAHLLQIFRATPSILREAEPINRQLKMLLGNFVVLADACEGRDPVNLWE